MAAAEGDRWWWLEGLGLTAGLVWFGARALSDGRPLLLRLLLAVGAVCFLAALGELAVDRVRPTKKGSRTSAGDASGDE